MWGQGDMKGPGGIGSLQGVLGIVHVEGRFCKGVCGVLVICGVYTN